MRSAKEGVGDGGGVGWEKGRELEGGGGRKRKRRRRRRKTQTGLVRNPSCHP